MNDSSHTHTQAYEREKKYVFVRKIDGCSYGGGFFFAMRNSNAIAQLCPTKLEHNPLDDVLACLYFSVDGNVVTYTRIERAGLSFFFIHTHRQCIRNRHDQDKDGKRVLERSVCGMLRVATAQPFDCRCRINW